VPRDDIARVWYKEAITRVIASEAKQSQTGIAGIRKRSPRHLVPRDDIAQAWFKEAISRVIASVAKQSQQGLQVFE